MSEKMRDAFEAWMRVDNTLPLKKDDYGYADFTTSIMWHVWQAAQKAIAEKPSRTSDSGCTHEFVLDPSSSIRICLHCGRSNIGLSKRAAPPAPTEQPAQGQNADGLLPCPFCGTEARFDWEERRGQNFYYAVCPKDECVARMGTDYCETKEAAAAIWNLRAEQQPAQGEAVARKYAPDYPEHDRMSCTDAEPFNATPAGSHGCARCTALVMDRAAPPAPSVPDGWKLVPVNATSAMLEVLKSARIHEWSTTRAVYAAMLAASPEVKP